MPVNRMTPHDLFFNSMLIVRKAVYYRGKLVTDIKHHDEENFALEFADGTQGLIAIEADDCLVIVDHNPGASIYLQSPEVLTIIKALEESVIHHSEELRDNYHMFLYENGANKVADGYWLEVCKKSAQHRRNAKRALAVFKAHGWAV